jgi:hypothetical protein
MKTTIRLFSLVLAFLSVTVSPQAQAVCLEGCGIDFGNTFLGDDALLNNFGLWNTAVGAHALVNNDTNGVGNTAIGFEALVSNTAGSVNTAIGSTALLNNVEGTGNTAVGNGLVHNTTGDLNTATGGSALYANTTGFGNTATGSFALNDNNGDLNTATGNAALWHNLTGSENTADGAAALEHNTTGSENRATGNATLNANSTRFSNTATGFYALSNNTTGNNNIALGVNAGVDLTTGDDNIDIGNAGFAGESSKIRIGTEGTHTATYIAGISEAGLVHGAAVAVGITADGQLGVRASSVRFKELVKPMDKASEAIFSLQPVSFRYKKDPAALPQFGLVAEEVAKVNPDLVARDVEGKPFTVRYDEINAMLPNEFLKEHRKGEKQEATIAELKTEMAILSTTVKAQAAQLQRVSAQLELSKSARQTAINNQ